MTKTLYGIEADFQALDELLTQLEGDIGDEESQAIYEQMVNEIQSNLSTKADGYAWVIQDALDRADVIKQETVRLRALMDTWTNKAKRMKAALLDAMDRMGIQKIDGAYHKLSIATNGGKAPLILPDSPESLPHCYQRQMLDFDKDAIRADLEAGKTIDGCAIGERGRGLRIK